MKFKEKLKYISNRALVLGTVVFGSFIILAVIQLLLAYKGETPWWMAIIITIFAFCFQLYSGCGFTVLTCVVKK